MDGRAVGGGCGGTRVGSSSIGGIRNTPGIDEGDCEIGDLGMLGGIGVPGLDAGGGGGVGRLGNSVGT